MSLDNLPGRVSRHKVHVAIVAIVSAVGLAACGGSSKPKTQTSAPVTTASTATTPPPATSATAGHASVTSGPVRATLTGENHAPLANKSWTYSVRVTDAGGHPLDGTVETEFVFSGQVVGRETPPTHPLKNGVLKDSLTFPSQAVGEPISLQVVVHTSKGSVTLDWPVTVKP